MKEATKKLLSFFLIQKVSEANSLPKPDTDEPVGFGFSPSPPNDPDPSLDRTPPASDNLDHLTTDEELQNQEMANREHQILQLITEEIENQLAIDDWIHNGGFEEKGTLGEELRYQQAFDEEFRNLVLEEMAGFSEYGRDRELDVEGEGRDERDDDDDRSENGKEDENVGGESGLTVGSTDGRHRGYSYPVRPDAEDCSFYMRTGACKFGSNCKFNHPFRRRNQAAKENEESPERPTHAECKYFLSSGGCKYGKACRYKHSVRKTPVAPIAEFNFLGLPIRLGEKECPYYMRNGSCKYGLNCRFNHPDPTAVGGGDDLSGYGNGGSGSLQGASQSTMSSWSPPRALNETSPFVPVMFSPTKGAPSSYPERNGHQPGKDRAYPAPSERRLPTPPAFSLNSAADNNFYKHHKPPPMLIDEFPERPGQPVCSYFLKTGDCKYKSGCKFHHPKNRMPKTAASPMTVSDNGLPQRPDQNICSHYSRYGICKFGPACRFDHPLNFSSLSASPLPRFVGPGNHPPPYSNSATTDDGWDSWE